MLMANLSGLVQLMSSGANGILTLEGQNTTCADVFYVWVCIAWHLEKVLSDTGSGVGGYRGQVTGIYNHRFNQMMTESSHNIFLFAYFLNPRSFPSLSAQVSTNFFSRKCSVPSSRWPPVEHAASEEW